MRQSHISKLKDKKSPQSDEEWEKTLTSALRDGEFAENVGVLAHLVGPSMTLTFRKEFHEIAVGVQDKHHRRPKDVLT